MNKIISKLTDISNHFMNNIKALIPRKIKNETVLKAIEFLRRRSKMPSERILENAFVNREILCKSGNGILCKDSYIENQHEWKGVRFGSRKRSAVQYSGCGIIATYNALMALGETVSSHRLVELISRYERNGAVLKGDFGISPVAIADYFRENGYRTDVVCGKEKDSIDRLGADSATVIVTVYNDRRNIMAGMHTVNITKDSHNKYFIHNAYTKNKDNIYVSKDNEGSGFDTLQDAVDSISCDPALLYAIGISKLCP